MGPPRKRASSRTSKGVPITQKKQRTDNSSPDPTAPTEEWIEQNTVVCKTKSNMTEECGVKREPEEEKPDPNRINGEVSGLADDPLVQGLSLEKYNKIKEEQEECDISTNQEPEEHSFGPPFKVDPEDQKWMVKDNDENPNVATLAEEKWVKPYTCFCGKSYTCTSHLNRHHRKTHGSQIQPSGHYNNVIREKKPVERCYTCQCGKQYTRNSNLRRHQNSCSEQAPLVTTKRVVKYRVVEDQEEKIKPYVCACGKSYTCSSHLYRHQRTHVDSDSQTTRRFICECGKAYSCSSHLYRHRKTHSEEKVVPEERPVKEDPEDLEQRVKPHLCFCGKRYTCSSHLYRHQKAHHAQIFPIAENHEAEDNETGKRYKCDCGKSYTSSSHLYRHQRTHKNQESVTEEVNDLDHDSEVEFEECRQKPYTCECGKSFILSFSLLLHKKIHCRWKNTTDCDPPGH
ncbi:zinc finger protein 436-like isoform X2 [Rana temporaria]|uniref:zinc finger protein 436-like isoform X2 n=1 Tax=Rana temporaria TaxID=8407 RepID=UPI001AAC7CF5|nr:zinc finger protein 436-like isoform X2 [Rana temporaria]